MRRPTVTIAIPFRNPGEDLVLAVKSVFAQSYSDWELILCDDGSDDGSVEFARSLDDPRVRVTVDGLRKGLAQRINETVCSARGQFYFRMDADDVMHPDRVRDQLAELERATPNTVIGTACYSIDRESRTVGIRPARKPGKGFAARHNFAHASVAARTEWFRRNPYNEQVMYHRSEDAELWCRASGTAEFVVMPQMLMYFREGNLFYFTKYLGTSLGVVHLARDYGRTKAESCYLLSRELGKVWLTCILDTLGKVHWLVNRRFQKIEPDAAREADEIMERIKTQPLATAGTVRTLKAGVATLV